MSDITITCYGPRGSLPSPSYKGFSTLVYGGNTSSYHVQAGPFSFFLDLGSGVSNLGDRLMKSGKGVGKSHICLLSHWHWDHIQGGPFCVPFFVASNTFHFHGFAPAGQETERPLNKTVELLLSSQQVSPHFPVAHGAMPSNKVYQAHQRQFSETFYYVANDDGTYTFVADSMACCKRSSMLNQPMPVDRTVKVTTIPLNHPDGCLGYRIEYMNKVIVYCTDDEPLMFLNKEIVKHAKNADWLLMDGQYTHEQLSGMYQTFGHGTPSRCVETAQACGAKLVVVHHHDPKHDDNKVALMENEATLYAADRGYTGKVEFAREGMVWEL